MSDNIEERAANYLSGWLALLIWLALFGAALWQIFAPSLLQGRSPDSISGFLALPVLIFLVPRRYRTRRYR